MDSPQTDNRSDDNDPTGASTFRGAVGYLRPGLVLSDRYRIDALLGRGGMGEVWLAWDLKLCVGVALKSLRSDLFADAERRELMRHEVRAARGVVSPHVCRTFDLVEADGQELLSMEYIDGATLKDTFRHRGPLGLREASAVAAQLLAGLEAVHEAGLVHRDLKPENIMITRSGRVVIMDLGVARTLSAPWTGSVAGTPGYMAPEQARGDTVDARADVFAAGIVLAELIDPEAARDGENLRAFLQGIREAPPQLPESPWKAALKRALAADPEQRYRSAAAMARALDEATQRAAGPAERIPYPGLAAFTEAESELFFGREAEVESMWKKLQRLHLIAVVGPSGAGKSSFLHAGLIPARPEGWAYLVCTPGVSPFVALGQALAPHLAGQSDVLRDMVRFHEPEVAAGLFARWRQRHAQALLVFDQFEELFTLNGPEIQQRFANLVGRLSLDADVHVLLSMRDDYLFRCHEQAALSPILGELTLLGPPRGSDLRRAITRPAITCGYRFEDDAMVDEMVAQVTEERGALPLLAFAAARLWDLRDRERGLLTREAYARIGGVGGALAQHADATCDRIAPERQSMVREVFRHLVTAEGTRVARDRDELISVFEDPNAASQVLDELVDARLLTSFEVGRASDDPVPRHRIEVIHESLFTAWPRLVRWRTQDAQGAQLHDHLRQAAQLWRDRGRPEDLLWTGIVYREFELWRERNPGRLAGMEEEFSRAMNQHAQRRRRQRRRLIAGAFAVLLGVLFVVGALWRKSETARQSAVSEARRAEASKLLTLSQTSPDTWDALAYAIGSLELAEQPEARRQAIRIMEGEPTRFQFSHVPGGHNPWTVDVSPDGQWLSIGWSKAGHLQLHPLSGGAPVELTGNRAWIMGASWSADSRFLATGTEENTLAIFSVAEKKLLCELHYQGVPRPHYSRALGAFLVAEIRVGVPPRWHAVSPEGKVVGDFGPLGPVVRGRIDPSPAVDSDGARVAEWSGGELYLRDIRASGFGPRRTVGAHDGPPLLAAFDLQGRQLVTVDDSSEVRVWSVAELPGKVVFAARGGNRPTGACFDREGKRLAVGFGDGLRVWDLTAPAWMSPMMLESGRWVFNPAFLPTGRWLAASAVDQAVLAWPLGRTYASAIHLEQGSGLAVRFSPDGRWLATASFGVLRVWPLDDGPLASPRELLRRPGVSFSDIAFDASGRILFATGHTLAMDAAKGFEEEGVLVAISIKDGRARFWRDPPSSGLICVDKIGRFVASTGGGIGIKHATLVDLASGRATGLQVGGRNTSAVGFTLDGHLILQTGTALHAYDPVTGTTQPLGIEAEEESAYELAPGQFVWLDRSGQDWLGDLVSGRSRARPIPTNGRGAGTADALGDTVAVGFDDGSVELRDLRGGEPYLLLGQKPILSVALDPRGRWVASAEGGAVLYLWPVPQGSSVQRLPHEAFVAKLRSLTNLRAVRDSSSVNGYSVKAQPFPGWEPVPNW